MREESKALGCSVLLELQENGPGLFCYSETKIISEECRLIALSGHIFDHKICFVSGLKEIVPKCFVFVFVFFLKECKPNGAKR